MKATEMQKAKSADNELLKKINDTKALYIAAVLFLVLFIVVRADALAVVAAVLFIIGVIVESIVSAKEKGLGHEIKEIVIAIAIALVLWFGSSLLLNTSSPFNGVVSCSMLNTLQRGDVVVLQGGAVKATEVNISGAELDRIITNGEEHYICAFCSDGNNVRPCSIDPRTGMEALGDVLHYKCGVCRQKRGASEMYTACTEGVYIKGVYVDATLKQGDIVVYRPAKEDLFAMTGDIIHRALVKINADGNTYYLIKGDNNPLFDVQGFDSTLTRTNGMVNESQILGKSVFVIPFLGYVKLVAAGQLENPENCNIINEYINTAK